MENKVVNILIEFIKAAQNLNNGKKPDRVECVDDGVMYGFSSTPYLLGQLIRNYSQDWNHYLISEEALKTWKALTDDDMRFIWGRNKVNCTKDNDLILYKYKGNSNDSEEVKIKKGDTFTYNDIFHDEHIVTISDIEKELLALEDVTKENVIRILDKIYVCRMLKVEDRGIYPKRHRSNNYREVLDGPYKKAGIKVIEGYFHD